MLLAIDPGETTGYAVFEAEDHLVDVGEFSDSTANDVAFLVMSVSREVTALLEAWPCSLLAVECPPIPPTILKPIEAMYGALLRTRDIYATVVIRPHQKTPIYVQKAKALLRKSFGDNGKFSDHIVDAVTIGLIAFEEMDNADSE